MGIRFIKIAAVYLAIGVTMGLAMGITQKFALHPVHAHINLLGWATMALAGLIYLQFPQAALTRLAKIHFWMHNLALPVMMVGLTLLLSGYTQGLYLLEPASTVMVIGLLIFVANVCLNIRAADENKMAPSRRLGRPVTAEAAAR